VASASGPGWPPSGSRSGFVTTVGSRAGSWRRLDCRTASALRRRHERAISRGKDGSFGPRPRRVLDDVGVRFGGSEHHRIETSSSHTRPRPTGQGSRPPGQGNRRSSEHRAPGSTGARQTAPFGAPRARPHRSREPGALRSIGHPTPPGARQPALFGAPRARPHRGTANGVLRSTARTASSGQGTWRPSGHRAPHPTRDREPDLLGGLAPHLNPGQSPQPRWQGTPAHRGTANGALRSTARTASPGHGKRRSSEHRAHGLTGAGNPALLGATGPPLHPGQGTGPPRRTGPPPHRVRTSLRDGHPAHWGRADGASRGTASLASPGPGNRSSSEPRALGPVRDRDPELLGARAPRFHRDREPGPPRRPGAPASARAGTSSLAPATGAPRSLARQDPGLESRTSSEARTPHLTGHRPPRPPGQGHRRPAGWTNGVYATRLGGLAVGKGHRPRSGPGAGQDGNGRKATAAVMRYGCWRGEIFEGCEPRRGD
jgi:hypothetical protein